MGRLTGGLPARQFSEQSGTSTVTAPSSVCGLDRHTGSTERSRSSRRATAAKQTRKPFQWNQKIVESKMEPTISPET